MRSAPIPPNPPNPPNPGQNDPVPGQTSLQGPDNPAVEAVRTLRPTSAPLENRPSAVPAPGDTNPAKPAPLDVDPLQPLNFNPENPTPQRRYGPPLLQGDRHAPESVIGLSELVIGIVGIRTFLALASLRLSLTWVCRTRRPSASSRKPI